VTTSEEPADADPTVDTDSPVDLSAGGLRDQATERAAVDAEFSAFYRTDFPRLVGCLILSGAPREDALDAAQETMRKLYQKWREVDHPRAWARTTARHAVFRALRFSQQQDLGEPPEAASALLVGDQDLWESLQFDEVLAILRELPPCQRQVMALTYDGFKPAEIAPILEVPADQVRGNLARARRTAARVLGKRKGERQ
jgi:RNA polymerase sigma-70 factor (ECF subfamily)